MTSRTATEGESLIHTDTCIYDRNKVNM